MSPLVRPGKKGRVRVEFDTTRLIPEDALLSFAGSLRQLRGVKRAMVRTESGVKFVFARIDESVPGVVELIGYKARQFWRSFFAPPAPRRRGGRVFHNKPQVLRARKRGKRYPPKYMPVAA